MAPVGMPGVETGRTNIKIFQRLPGWEGKGTSLVLRRIVLKVILATCLCRMIDRCGLHPSVLEGRGVQTKLQQKPHGNSPRSPGQLPETRPTPLKTDLPVPSLMDELDQWRGEATNLRHVGAVRPIYSLTHPPIILPASAPCPRHHSRAGRWGPCLCGEPGNRQANRRDHFRSEKCDKENQNRSL